MYACWDVYLSFWLSVNQLVCLAVCLFVSLLICLPASRLHVSILTHSYISGKCTVYAASLPTEFRTISVQENSPKYVSYSIFSCLIEKAGFWTMETADSELRRWLTGVSTTKRRTWLSSIHREKQPAEKRNSQRSPSEMESGDSCSNEQAVQGCAKTTESRQGSWAVKWVMFSGRGNGKERHEWNVEKRGMSGAPVCTVQAV